MSFRLKITVCMIWLLALVFGFTGRWNKSWPTPAAPSA